MSLEKPGYRIEVWKQNVMFWINTELELNKKLWFEHKAFQIVENFVIFEIPLNHKEIKATN